MADLPHPRPKKKSTSETPRKKPLSDIEFTAMLVENKQDRNGEWTVKFEVPKLEMAAMLALSLCTEKALKVKVTPPATDTIFGKISEE